MADAEETETVPKTEEQQEQKEAAEDVKEEAAPAAAEEDAKEEAKESQATGGEEQKTYPFSGKWLSYKDEQFEEFLQATGRLHLI